MHDLQLLTRWDNSQSDPMDNLNMCGFRSAHSWATYLTSRFPQVSLFDHKSFSISASKELLNNDVQTPDVRPLGQVKKAHGVPRYYNRISFCNFLGDLITQNSRLVHTIHGDWNFLHQQAHGFRMCTHKHVIWTESSCYVGIYVEIQAPTHSHIHFFPMHWDHFLPPQFLYKYNEMSSRRRCILLDFHLKANDLPKII